MKVNAFNLDRIGLVLAGSPAFRRVQANDAIYKGLKKSWSEATNLPSDLKNELNKESPLEISSKLFESKDGRTSKALIYLGDGNCIETVLMSLNGRHSVCVSTQVGCPMGCTFCDSGRGGFIRNLTVSEIVAQILFFARHLKTKNEKVTNIIFMGMGEPFLNYENVIDSIRLISSKEGLGLSIRRFSISTSGIIPGISKLAAEKNLPVNLAISLHSALDEKRKKIMPVDNKYPLCMLSESIKGYFQITKRKLMYEYILLGGVNTSEKDAQALREFIDDASAAYTVNLIPINPTDCGYDAPSAEEISSFKRYLDELKINYVQRYSFGKDISAACGQLARKENV